MDFFSVLLYLLLVVMILFFVVLVIRVPIMIAKVRGVSGDELITISILSWCGLLFGVTWIVAFVLALVYEPDKWIGKQSKNLDLDRLEKLHSLMKKGAISKSEYDAERKKLLKKKLY